MLSVNVKGDWIPLTQVQNYFIECDEEGTQSLQFDIPLNDQYYMLLPETPVKSDDNLWLVKQINQMTSYATVTCELDIDEWRSSYYYRSAEDVHLQTKTLSDALNYIKPAGWTIKNAGVRGIKRTLDLEKCTAYDLLVRSKAIYDIQYDIDALQKTITIVDPYEAIDNGVYITPELNLIKSNYKGDSKQTVTRLYCYGADDMTFESINDGKPYVEDMSYKGKPVCASWTDGRYTNIESLLEDGKKKLKELATPVGAYTLDVVDLAAINPKYKDLEFKLRNVVHCIIDPEREIDVIHRIVKIKVYPEEPHRNKITLSNQPRSLEKEWNALKENVNTVQRDGYRYETEIKQTNEEITEVAKKTDENTKGIQSVEEKLTPEQLMILVSDSINDGKKLNTMKFIADINGIEIKNGGIKVRDGNDNLVLYVDEKTKKMVFNGHIQAVSGNIAGWSIDENGLYSSFEIDMPAYTQTDLDKVKNHINKTRILTGSELDYYDITRDGYVTSLDYVIMKNIMMGITSRHWKYQVRINPKNTDAIIYVSIDRGNGIENTTKISAMGIKNATIDSIIQRLENLENK